jgi:nitrite reductase (NADH) small subunit
VGATSRALGSRVVKSAAGDIAVFRTNDDEVFALHDKCPHKGGPLSQGIVHGDTVTCPLHGWKTSLEDGNAVAPDIGCTKPFAVKAGMCGCNSRSRRAFHRAPGADSLCERQFAD